MTKRTKISLAIIGVIVVVAGALYASQSPIAKYEIGRVKAAMSRRQGNVAGLYMVKLPVTFHRQEHSLSCEAAAVTMALNYKGANVTESDVISKLVFDPTARTSTTWGNPYTGFVGAIDGKMSITGYGVYWQPIADAANNWKYTEALENMTPQDLAMHLLNDRPIVIWGYYGAGKTISWQTPDGQQINAVNGEHARTVIGFVGDQNTPIGFSILDPIYGELYWTTEQLLENWKPFNNAGVVVY